MSDFEKQIHAMFDHIWDCDINHPIFEDTVGELMNAVIQCYNSLPSSDVPDTNVGDINCTDCIKHGGDWECDHVNCHKGKNVPNDAVSRKQAIEGHINFEDGEWYKLHCEYERHHLLMNCPENVKSD